jgi:uncharacterized RDD family membrane protein YckC
VHFTLRIRHGTPDLRYVPRFDPCARRQRPVTLEETHMSYTPPPPPPGGGYPPPAGGSPYGGGATRDFAEPVPRIVAGLVDYVALSVLAGILYRVSFVVGALLSLAGLAFGLYNAYLNGQTGQSVGKKMQNIKVVGMETGAPIGGGMGIVRYLCHIIDGCICYLGYIYGLFIDKDKQTIADKIVKTVVVKA